MLHKFFTLLLALSSSIASAEVKEAMKAGDTISKCVRPSPVALYGFGPDCKETIQRAGQSSEMSYNASGLRDKNFAPKPRPGWARILFLGPSLLAAPGIAEQNTPPKRLEALLRKTNKQVEVLNAGVEGYSAIQIAARTAGWIKDYSPTHVVLYLDLGQSANIDPMHGAFAKWEPDGTVGLAYSYSPLLLKLAGFMNWDMKTYPVQRRLQTIEGLQNRARLTIGCKLRNRSGPAFTACLLSPTLASLQSIQKQAADAGAKFLFAASVRTFSNDLKISPGQDPEVARFFDRITPVASFPASEVRDALERLGMPLLYVDMSMGSDYTLPGDYHLNEKGSVRFAESLKPRVLELLGK